MRRNVYAVQGFNIKAVDRDGGTASVIVENQFLRRSPGFRTAPVSTGWKIPSAWCLRAPGGSQHGRPMALGSNNEHALDMQVSGNFAYWLGGGDVLEPCTYRWQWACRDAR